MTAALRLPFLRTTDWRSRWLHIGGGSTLHRAQRVEATLKAWREWPHGPGETVCGLRGDLHMPGFVSRLSAKRCPKCCKSVGIPLGLGAPYNDASMFPPEGRALITEGEG